MGDNNLTQFLLVFLVQNQVQIRLSLHACAVEFSKSSEIGIGGKCGITVSNPVQEDPGWETGCCLGQKGATEQWCDSNC